MTSRRVWCSMFAALLVAPHAGAQPFQVEHRLPSGGRVAVDDTTVVVSATVDVPSAPRDVLDVYANGPGGWALQQRLEAPSDTAFAESVDIDGDTLVASLSVVVPPTSTERRIAVYVRSGTAWSLQAQLPPPSPLPTAVSFGAELDLDGDRLIVGAPGVSSSDSDYAGAAFVFERTAGTWTGARLPSPAITARADFGGAVGVLGNIACVGAPTEDTGGGPVGGALRIYTRGAAGWSLQQRLVAGVADRYGSGCAIDGDTVFVASAARREIRILRQGQGVWEVAQTLLGAEEFPVLRAAGGVLVFNEPNALAIYGRTGNTFVLAQRLSVPFVFALSFDGVRLVCECGVDALGDVEARLYSRGASPPPTGPPGAPANVQATVTGNTIGLTWSPPTSGAPPTGYSLIGRVTPGGPILATLPMGASPPFSIAAPNGAFVLTVQALNASGVGPESAAVTVAVPQAAPAPGPPQSLTATVAGNTVSFTWSPPAAGASVSAYVLAAGVTPGFTTPFVTAPLGATPGFVAPGVPSGTYYVRILAQNAGGSSAPSNEVTFTVVGAAPPGAPTFNAPSLSGSTVNLSWAPGTGGTPTGYTLVASVTPTGPPIASVALGGTSASFPGVPTGTYYLRLTASNAAGTSSPSAEITLVVP